MIVISSIEFDIRGAVILFEDEANTTFGTKSRRQNRIATLDGGSVLFDRSYSVSDLDFNITVKQFTANVFDRLNEMVENNPTVRMTNIAGDFIGSIRNLVDADRTFSFRVLSDG